MQYVVQMSITEFNNMREKAPDRELEKRLEKQINDLNNNLRDHKLAIEQKDKTIIALKNTIVDLKKEIYQYAIHGNKKRNPSEKEGVVLVELYNALPANLSMMKKCANVARHYISEKGETLSTHQIKHRLQKMLNNGVIEKNKDNTYSFKNKN